MKILVGILILLFISNTLLLLGISEMAQQMWEVRDRNYMWQEDKRNHDAVLRNVEVKYECTQ